jgi:hypothetical protein
MRGLLHQHSLMGIGEPMALLLRVVIRADTLVVLVQNDRLAWAPKYGRMNLSSLSARQSNERIF